MARIRLESGHNVIFAAWVKRDKARHQICPATVVDRNICLAMFRAVFCAEFGIWYFADWTGLDWTSKTRTSKTWTSKTRTSKTRTSKTRTGKTWTSKTRTSKTWTSKTQTSKTRTGKTRTSKTRTSTYLDFLSKSKNISVFHTFF